VAEPLHIAVHEWQEAESLPPGWRVGFEDWAFAKQLCVRNELAAPRLAEPVELEVEFHADQVTDPVREVRVLAVPAGAEPGESLATEIPSQIHHVDNDDNRHRCRLYFLANLSPSSTHTWLVLYGNPAATVSRYETDLRVTGQEYALTVENAFYRIELAPTTGHLKSVTFLQGAASFSGFGPPMDPGVIGDGKHGVEGSVHWNPDWSDGHTGRYRVTNWPRPPHYTVIRGPVYTRVERWGHPILGLGPCGNYEKVRARVVYTFWASQPYVIMESSLEILQDVRFRDCRNDEWVGMGASMPQQAWMMANGELGFGRHGWQNEDPAWMSFYNEDNGDAFATLRLDYECTHPHFPAPASVAILDRAWVRYPVRNVIMRAGDVIREKNAILVHRYTPGPHDGFAMLMDCHARLRSPLSQEDVPVTKKPLTEPNVVDALRACRDLEIYVEGNYNSRRTPGLYDLGLVRDVEIDGEDVHLTMIMPCEGRRTWFEWFSEVAEQEIRRRLEPVGDVTVKLTDTPTWSPLLMSIGARRIMGFAEENA
jgi:metal-sulfur cluster biosynthetic enzyme